MTIKKGDIFDAWCHEFGKVIEVEALEDCPWPKVTSIWVKFVEGGHESVASVNQDASWETRI